MIGTARKHEIIERAAAAFEPRQDTINSGLEQFKLNRLPALLLVNNRSSTNFTSADKIANSYFDDVTPAELAVVCKIEHRAVA